MADQTHSRADDVEDARLLMRNAVFSEAIREIDPRDLADLFAAISELRAVQERIGTKLMASERVKAASALLAASRGS